MPVLNGNTVKALKEWQALLGLLGVIVTAIGSYFGMVHRAEQYHVEAMNEIRAVRTIAEANVESITAIREDMEEVSKSAVGVDRDVTWIREELERLRNEIR